MAKVVRLPRRFEAVADPLKPDDDRTVLRTDSRSGGIASESVSPSDHEGSSDPLAPGTRLGEFVIRSVIGRGGFAIVYLATDELLGREVALKEYLPESLACRASDVSVRLKSPRDADTFSAGLSSFINEARLLGQFDNASLVKVYRFWQENGTAYMVMPYYRGPTLKQELSRRATPPDERWLRSIIDPLLDALETLHANHCYHRDIAPDNILLVNGSNPVLLDFGAARRVIEDRAKTLTVILKPGYAPVEQYGEAEGLTQGAWTDIYAVGAVIHAAITGKPPPPSSSRAARDSMQPLSVIARGRYSEAFLRAIDRALAVHPDDRPQSIAEFRKELGRAAEQEADSDSHRPIRRPFKVIAAGAVGVVLFGVAAFASWRYFGSPDVQTAAPVASTARGSGPAAAVPPALAPAPGTQASADPGRVLPAPPEPDTRSASPPAAPAVPAVTAQASDPLEALLLGRDPAHEVSVGVSKPLLKIGRDNIRFSVTSSRSGFVYVFMRGTRDELVLLFPNRFDGSNAIEAGAAMALPRKAWALTAGGPPGADRFVAIVSQTRRDFSRLRPARQDGFSLFSPEELSAAAARQPQSPVLAGTPVCRNEGFCPAGYGAAAFEMQEVK